MALHIEDLKMSVNCISDMMDVDMRINGTVPEDRYRMFAALEHDRGPVHVVSALYDTTIAEYSKALGYDIKTNWEYTTSLHLIEPKKVIFNGPATIVFWSDGTKTVVKLSPNDKMDREKGFAMACAKKFFGNEGNYYNRFKEALKNE